MNKHGVKDNGVWFETLKDLTPRALERGMERLKALEGGDKFSEFPPNCLQFRGLCLAYYEELKLPRAMDAYREIKGREFRTNARWSHSIVKYIASKLPAHFLTIHQEHEAYAIFEEIYNRVCHVLRQGHALPETKEPLMFKKNTNPDVAKSYLNQMKQRLGASQ